MPFELDDLAKASASLVEFFRAHCNIHQCIVIDSAGVRIVSDECFVTSEDCCGGNDAI